ncbi:BnaA04g16320D [Brassica napus]|uniref:BnaA04g16320D protein n=1 Tax=Brassica napus TaxID=3708 RepID=A0A078GYD7_BRANA|nr:BnaA04g16320D [Brassica napus]
MMSQDHVGSDQTQIIKGKRTKRQRSLSSTFLVAAAAATTNTSSSSSAGDGGGGRAVSDEYNSAVSSPVTTTDCTEEEEDMAICLIMLARGAALSPDLKNSRKADKTFSPAENSSFFVYECKTCSRTFSSFQALGGHRASHKKPREGQKNNFKANKVHECSICGSEFTSGQALGGHMRRHRTATTAVIPVATTEVSRNSTEEETENLSSYIEQRKYLPLDLNLPAPEDDLRESKFQGIVFSTTPALIDCHY